jgi:cell division protein FtsB
VSDLKNTKQELEEELDTIDTDAFVERQARDEYDYMMPDELRFVITFPDEETEEPSL